MTSGSEVATDLASKMRKVYVESSHVYFVWKNRSTAGVTYYLQAEPTVITIVM